MITIKNLNKLYLHKKHYIVNDLLSIAKLKKNFKKNYVQGCLRFFEILVQSFESTSFLV